MNRTFRFSETKARELVTANGNPEEVKAFPNYANHYSGIHIRRFGEWVPKSLQDLNAHTQSTPIEIKIGGMFITCSEELQV